MKDRNPLVDMTQESAGQSKGAPAAAGLVLLACLAWALTAAAQSPHSASSDGDLDSTLAAKALEGKHQETWATCQVLVWISGGGRVQAAQVINPYGSSLLEQACLNLAIGQTLHSVTNSEPANYRWAVLPIKWVTEFAPKTSATSALPVPLLARDQTLHVDPSHYPEPALTSRKEGVCAIHIVVDATGEAQHVTITRTTGTPELDSACVDAIRAARFTPARRGDQNVAAATDVWLRWVLP